MQMTEGRGGESVLGVGLVLDREYSVLMVGDGLDVSVVKVGEVDVRELRLGEDGLEAMAAS